MVYATKWTYRITGLLFLFTLDELLAADGVGVMLGAAAMTLVFLFAVVSGTQWVIASARGRLAG
jgi:hypothetical protein